jgi:hypothetical protein
VIDDRAEDLTKSASGATGEPQPPAANQAKDEPIADVGGSSQTPGDSKGVSVPSVQAAAGTSEETGAMRIANAPPGKPDGEVDTRP